MWQHNYTPVAGSLALSSLAAMMPVFTLLYCLGVKRKPAWVASLWALAGAASVALALYRMPLDRLIGAMLYGAAFALFPIGWIVFPAILLYRVTVETGKLEIVKDSLSSLTQDRRLQALLIAFVFCAFIEGAAGFGAPVAICAAMLVGLGYSPFYAVAMCLLTNTVPVSFGSIAIPIITLAGVTGLPLGQLSAGVGRISAPVVLILPAYLVVLMGGWKALRGVLPAAAVCGIAYAGTELVVSNWIGVQLTDVLAALVSMAALVALMRFWKPSDTAVLYPGVVAEGNPGQSVVPQTQKRHSAREVLSAWGPYVLLMMAILLWGYRPFLQMLDRVSGVAFPWPGLHNTIQRMPPVVQKPTNYAAIFNFNWLSTAGTATMIVAAVSALLLGMTPVGFGRVFGKTVRQLTSCILTIAAVLAFAYLMNYSGATGTLGLAFAATGGMFPFFSAVLGGLGVFLTGSIISSNALFGTLQVVTAEKLGMNPILMAASNCSGGAMGKMISLQSIAVAAAAAGLKMDQQAKLFRFMIKHSVLLVVVTGLIVLFYAYVAPGLVP
jgi:lactate permease